MTRVNANRRNDDPGTEAAVWVVEDDADAQMALLALAESVGLAARAFASGEDFLRFHRPELGGCVVTDHRLPGMSGLELLGELRKRSSALPVILISGQADVGTAVAAIKQGAFDFLVKPIVFQDALDRIQAAIAAERENRENRRRELESSLALESLTERESEIMRLMISGKKNREIAERLRISERTVEIHRARVMAKTGAGSLAELVRMILTLSTERERTPRV